MTKTRITVLFFALSACTTEHSESAAQSASSSPSSNTRTNIDTPLVGDLFVREPAGLIHKRDWSQPDSIVGMASDPTVGRLGILQDSLVHFPDDPRTANWLWEAGNLMREHFSFVSDSGPAAEFARKHPEQFEWDQHSDAFVYTRYHLRELVRRFPTHELADDAAYRLADPLGPNECEEQVPCLIEYGMGFTGLNAFLTQFPNSEYAGAAVRRANDAFTFTLHDEAANSDLSISETLDAKTVDSLLKAYSSTAVRLPDSLRVWAQAAIDTAHQMLDSLARPHH